jgi:hypothetical protein
MWSLGSIAGSALGGFLAQPARFYPQYFSKDGLFGRYPYLLPNLVSVIVIVLAIIQGILFLKETNPRSPPPSRTQSRVQIRPPVGDAAGETTALLAHRKRRLSAASAFSTIPGGVSYVAESMPLPIDPSFDLRRGSIGSTASIRLKHGPGAAVKPVLPRLDTGLEAQFEHAVVEDHNEHEEPEPVKAFNKGVIAWTIALVFQSYHGMGFCALLPIYLIDQPQQGPGGLDLKGGLGMTLHDVGTYLAVGSLMSLFFQGVVFTTFVAKLGVWRAVLIVTVISPFMYIVIPFLSLLPVPGAGVYGVLAFTSFTGVIAFPAFLILLKNATPSPSVLGQVNGLAMSACSAARTVAPPLVGVFYSGLGSAGAWWSLMVVAAVAIIQFLLAPRPRDNEEEILRKAETAAVEFE